MNCRSNVRCWDGRRRGSRARRWSRGCGHGRGHGSLDCRIDVRSRRQRGGRQRLGHGSLHGRLNVGGWFRRGRCARGDGGGEERGYCYSDADVPNRFSHSSILPIRRFPRIRTDVAIPKILDRPGCWRTAHVGKQLDIPPIANLTESPTLQSFRSRPYLRHRSRKVHKRLQHRPMLARNLYRPCPRRRY